MRLTQLRERKGLTRRAVAKGVGVTGQAIGYYESGKREPDIRMLILLADFFSCTIDYLVEHDVDIVQGLSYYEVELVKNFRKMNLEDKEEILAILEVKLARLKKGISEKAM